MKLLLLFLACITVKLILGANLLIQNSPENSKLSNYVCKITKEIINTSFHTQDILVGSLGNNSRISALNDIIECLNNENAIVIMDFQKPIIGRDLRKASVMILDIEQISLVRICPFVMSNKKSDFSLL